MTAVLTTEPLSDREKHELMAGFAEYAVATTGSHGDIAPFQFALREDDKLVGAINGRSFWGSLQITNHWVPHNQRHHGYGAQLLDETEAFAQEVGCHFITVETFDVEARDFYLRRGFDLELERPGYTAGLHLYLLKKSL